MTTANSQRLFNEALIARTQALRASLGWNAEQMAKMLGVTKDAYNKYEQRTPLPHYLIPPFALLTGRSVEFVMTGRNSTARSNAASERTRLAAAAKLDFEARIRARDAAAAAPGEDHPLKQDQSPASKKSPARSTAPRLQDQKQRREKP